MLFKFKRSNNNILYCMYCNRRLVREKGKEIFKIIYSSFSWSLRKDMMMINVKEIRSELNKCYCRVEFIRTIYK